MKQMIAFVLICIFALLFIVSFLFYAGNWYGQALNAGGQIGLVASIFLFFVLSTKKEPTKAKRQ